MCRLPDRESAAQKPPCDSQRPRRDPGPGLAAAVDAGPRQERRHATGEERPLRGGFSRRSFQRPADPQLICPDSGLPSLAAAPALKPRPLSRTAARWAGAPPVHFTLGAESLAQGGERSHSLGGRTAGLRDEGCTATPSTGRAGPASSTPPCPPSTRGEELPEQSNLTSGSQDGLLGAHPTWSPGESSGPDTTGSVG